MPAILMSVQSLGTLKLRNAFEILKLRNAVLLSYYVEHSPHKHPDKDKTDKCTANLPTPKDKKISSVLLEHNSRLLQQ